MEEKIENLKKLIASNKKVGVAFSGGLDSTFLLYVTYQVLKENAIAYSIKTPYIPNFEVNDAQEYAEFLGVQHRIVKLDIPEEIRHNPEGRCYMCKNKLYTKLINEARKENIETLFDGSNTDDMEFRTGNQALKELNIKSPLKECGFTKQDVRELSREFGLPTWLKPTNSCLLTRLPYNTNVEDSRLKQIEKAEEVLHQFQLKTSKVKVHHDLARIEVSKDEWGRLSRESVRDNIVQELKKLGFTYVTMDLEEHKEGSPNLKQL